MSRDLRLVALAMFFWGVGETTFLEFRSLYLEQLGADPLQIGAILGAAGLVMTLSHAPAGYLADRFGRRPVIWASWLLGVAATWVMALARHLPLFVFGLLFYLFTTFVISPLYSYVTAARGEWSVGRAITFISATYFLGAVIGPLLGGAIGERVGLRQTFTLAAWLFALSTVFILFIRSQPVERVPPEERGDGRLFNRHFSVYLLVVLLATFAMFLPQPLSPNFLQNQRGLSLARIGWMFSLTNLGVVVFNLLLGRLQAGVGFVAAQGAVVVFALSLWRGDGFLWFALGYFMLGGYRSGRALAASQARGLIHAARMGLAFGLTETVGGLATVLAPPLAGRLYAYNPASMYTVSVAMLGFSILASLGFVLFSRRRLREALDRLAY